MTLASEIRSTLKLAGPVILTQVGFLTMQIVDALIAGKAGARELAGVGAGSAPHFLVFVFGMGLLFSLDAVVSQAYGAGNLKRCREAVIQGLWLALAAGLALTPLQLGLAAAYLPLTGADPEIAAEAGPYLGALSWSILPALGFIALQRYWQARNVVMPMVWVTIAANVVNALAAWALVLGAWGFPRMGAEGAGWATLAARTLMFASLALYTWRAEPEFRREWKERGRAAFAWNPTMIRELFGLGLPAGLHFLFEVGAFAIASTLAARLGTQAMGAHHTVLQVASFTFMFPVGFSAAAAVRVGNALGAGHRDQARRAGWVGIGLATGVMCATAVVLFLAGGQLVGAFSEDPGVRALAGKILVIAAFFQVFDGAQVSGAGALRGWGDTRGPMVANAIGHYPIGLALALGLCFGAGLGLVGLWIGLATGLAAVALGVTWRWSRVTRPGA
ncbi:MAG: MATE family efflux transporter [Bdellovibrionales bacterium]|nr:MATE family efflux transporter [Bdellovibrionales bacterium]